MSETTGTTRTKLTSSKKTRSTKSEGKKTTRLVIAPRKKDTEWSDFIEKFQKDLKSVKPVVDDRPPVLDVPSIYDPKTLIFENGIVKRSLAHAPYLTKLIYLVGLSPGKTDTFNKLKEPTYSTNYISRMKAAKQIEEANKLIKTMIERTGSRLPSVKEYAIFWKRVEDLIEYNSKFTPFWKVKRKRKEKILVGPSRIYFKQLVTEKSAKYPDKRPRVSFEISIKNVGPIGKMVVVLYSDYVPMTVKNFLAFCDPKAELTYKGCFFYFIFQNFYCQTGDVIENKGFGGTSIYGPHFGDEDHTVQHGERGMLTMFNTAPNRNQSQFLITFRELRSLNGNNVAFGKVIRGFHVLNAIESVGSKMTGRPRVEVFISDCDEI